MVGSESRIFPKALRHRRELSHPVFLLVGTYTPSGGSFVIDGFNEYSVVSCISPQAAIFLRVCSVRVVV